MATDGMIDARRDRLVIFASTLGTAFEWYDFFIYGTLANIVAGHFFPSENPAVSFLIFLGSFGVGFGMRPLGAILFGVLGDRLGRKYTFLVTITLMGVATAAVGLLPTYETIGIAAPILLVLCRVLQGLALGGEYGGAAIYVAEHAPRGRRGFYTSFIQSGVSAGLMLSLSVVLVSNHLVDEQAFAAWGWRIPFLFSLVLLGVSLWVRLKLKESPVFKAMKDRGDVATNPLRESFDSWPKIRRILLALFGLSAGLTVIWYVGQFQSLYFLQSSLRVEDTVARALVGAAAFGAVFGFIFFGWLSDRIGRRKLILSGYVLSLVFLFPLFHWIADAANPGLAAAMERAPVVVSGNDCRYDPFAAKQETACGTILDALSRKGVAYTKVDGAPGAVPVVTIGGRPVDASDADRLEAGLAAAGYDLAKVTPSFGDSVKIFLCLLALGFFSGMTYGPSAAVMVELFPARVRYTSLSVPYHIGTGYFGGFLPFISQYIVVRTGDPFAGFWYTFVVAGLAFLVALIWLPETAGKELE
ncbi:MULTISPECIES: MFS transporter [unclassified Sphingomonas]|uniref:MFS transporter n=1 Tax=unclassified Sphingomonas TaxID=196159 RepID=UPI0006FBB489|nr:MULTISPECIES: MFS transporter [unclassified Sphingomonas]KQX20234.1 MFS transporter [Sphingomonas sp. Root1294]KQY67484.1 MFS transporter [Sphingomonas sp. Root50]KRB90861.1 MFS transporter [Sphingomonas sp. Root720]